MTSTAKGYFAIRKQADNDTAVKPNKFIRANDGDITKTVNHIKHKPLQNSKRGVQYTKPGKHDVDGDMNTDFDFNESVWTMWGALGTLATADVSSATDDSANRHTITVTEGSLPAFTVERAIGNVADTTNDKQNYIVKRGLGVKVDQFTLQAAEGEAVKLDGTLQMLSIFDQAILKSDAASGSGVDLLLDDVEGLTTDDTVAIFDGTTLEEDAVASIDAAAKSIEIATLGASFDKEETKVELAAQTPSYGTPPQNASLFDIKVQMADNITAAASAAEINVDNITYNHQNNIQVVGGTKRRANGRVDSTRPGATIELKKVFTNKAEYDTRLRNKQQAIIITIDSGVVISATDTNNTTYKAIIMCPNVIFDVYEIPTDNDAIYEIEATLEIVNDDTEGYAMKVLVDNAKIGTYYTG